MSTSKNAHSRGWSGVLSARGLTALGVACSVACLGACAGAPEDELFVDGEVESAATLQPVPFLQGTGAQKLLVVEAENAQRNRKPPVGDTWERVTAADASGGALMSAGTNNGNSLALNVNTGPLLAIDGRFVVSGTHTLWIRGQACNTQDDAIHVAVDGVATKLSWALSPADCSWRWISTTINIPWPGTHTLQLAIADDGFKLDKVLVTTKTSAEYTPTGVGPAESARVVRNQKFHRGHFVSANHDAEDPDTVRALLMSTPGLRGVQLRYTWAELESSPGNYDFSRIERDLQLVQDLGKTLVIFLEDRSMAPGPNPLPAYLDASGLTFENKKGGRSSKRWDPALVRRLNMLTRAIATRFDGHPGLEGIAFQETAMSDDYEALAPRGYTPELYRDAIINSIASLRAWLPSSQVFYYMNFIPKSMTDTAHTQQGYLREIATAVAPLNIVMGGPDILPENRGLQIHAYPLYKLHSEGGFAGVMNLFCAAQNESYSEFHTDTWTYWTPTEIFNYARDVLHVKYVFWNYKYWPTSPPLDTNGDPIATIPVGAYQWDDALPTIAANPSFNGALGP